MKLTRNCILGIMLLGLLKIGGPLWAAENDYTLKIATMKLPPYGWVDKNKKGKGIIYDMTQEMAIRAGIPFSHKVYPFNRMLEMLKIGKVDILSSQPHQRALTAGDKLALQFKINVIAATKKNSGIKNILGFKGKTLVYHYGSSYQQLEGIPGDIKFVSSYEQSLEMLHKRIKVHGAVFSEPAYYFFMKKINLSPRDFGAVIYIERDKEQWMFVRKDLPKKIRAKLKKAVEELYQENMFEKLLKKYGKD